MVALHPLTPTERLYWIALASVAGIGTQTIVEIWQWCRAHGYEVEQWWGDVALQKLSGLSAKKRSAIQDWQERWQVAEYSEWLTLHGFTVLVPGDQTFPASFDEISHPPAILICQGDSTALQQERRVAVIGTRQITVYGKTVTEILVEDAVKGKAVIISGGMYGVDQVAHQTAVLHGGQTVVVLGFGHQHRVTAELSRLYETVVEQGGAVLSEYPPWFPPTKGTFPARNRVVAALSQVVVVTEAGWQSGSHITASFAAEYGREVCAVPGPVTNPASDGAVRLVNEGAHLVRGAADVFQLMGWELDSPTSAIDLPNKPASNQVVRLLQTGPFSSQQLADYLGWSEIDCIRVLTGLQLDGVVVQYKSRWGLTRRIWHNGISA